MDETAPGTRRNWPLQQQAGKPGPERHLRKKEVMRDAEPVKSEKLMARALVVRLPDAKLVHPSVQFCRHLWGAASNLRLAVLSASPVPGAGKNKGGPKPALMWCGERQSCTTAASRSFLFTRSASKVQATADSRYTVSDPRPKRDDRYSAMTGAKAAPSSQAMSAVSAAPV